jgi:RNA polymerase primary sigma factor
MTQKRSTPALIPLKLKNDSLRLSVNALKLKRRSPKKAITAKKRKERWQKLGELFKFFKLTPRVFDPLVETPRAVLAVLA